MREPVYCTRESVMYAPDIRATAYIGDQIDDAIISGARSVDKLTHRTFYPWYGTRTFDWPNAQNAGSYRLWLDQNDLTSLTSASSGGIDISSSVLLSPASGPPFTRIELDRATGAAFNQGSGTGQRSISLTGVWAYSNQESLAGTIAVDASSGDSTIRYTPIARVIGIGATARINAERLLVSGKQWVDSGQSGSLAASAAATSLSVSDSSVFIPGEELMIDSEVLLVQGVRAGALIVKRAWAGSVLAAHSASGIYWPRDLLVERGALGTTAAAATSGTQIHLHNPPAPIAQLNRAYALDTLFQEGSAYARTVGSGDSERPATGRGVRELEDRVYGAYGRRYRARAV